MLVLDTETRIDASQRLTFGSYRVYRGDRLVQEGLVHADDLPPDDVATLRRYVAEHPADNRHPLRLLTRSAFVGQVLWKVGYKARALIVGFNLGFDLSRLAVGWTTAKRGGFSLRLYESRDAAGNLYRHKFRPDVRVRSFGSKQQFISFAAPRYIDDVNRSDDGGIYRGRFLDLHMAAFALTDESMTLASAAKAFGVDPKGEPAEHGVITEAYVDYNRQDVRVTRQLALAVQEEWAHHPVDLAIEQLYSPATVGKGYLHAMGITPPRDRARTVSDAELGIHMSAYYGGRTECRVRAVPMPVRYVDLTSMYPTVFALLGLWAHVIARELRAADATGDARDLLATVTRESLHDPATWRRLATVVCRVRPGGELLPERSRHGSADGDDPAVAWTIGLNHVVADRDLWYTLADLVAAKLLGGSAPAIVEARRIEAVGVMDGLRPVALRGSVHVDPATDDFFVRVIEDRQRIKRDPTIPDGDRIQYFLKILANACAYGVFAEVRHSDAGADDAPAVVYGLDPLRVRGPTNEEAGVLCLPPLAATITGGARLLLALLQADVESRGGTYVLCDTDSLAIVSTRDGGLVPCPGGPERMPEGAPAVRALAWREVDDALAELDRLNPYDRERVPSLVKVEDENFWLGCDGSVDRTRPVDLFAMSLSSKRYVLYERRPTGPFVRKASRHGLGMYADPDTRHKDGPGWVEAVFERYIRRAEGLEVGPEPGWSGLPAVSQLRISTPRTLGTFRLADAGRSYADGVKPYGFMTIAHRDPLVAQPPAFPDPVVPVAPYAKDPAQLDPDAFVDRRSGTPAPVTTDPGGAPGRVRVKTYRDVIAAHRTHPEHKSGDPDGGPGVRSSVGLLPRIVVQATGVRHIGKESNRLDDVEAGMVDGEEDEDPYVEYRDAAWEWRQDVARLQELRARVGTAELARLAGIPERTVRHALTVGKVPRRAAREGLRRALDEDARAAGLDGGVHTTEGDIDGPDRGA